jgi:hypothetical protein
MLAHTVLARDVLSGDTAQLPYAFVRRAQVAALPALPAESTKEAPAYLMDLGLRRWTDPQALFEATLAAHTPLAQRWRRLSERQRESLVMRVRQWEVGQVSSMAMAADLESLVLCTGDHAAARLLAGAISSSVRPVDTPRLAVGCAAVLAARDPGTAKKLLRMASSQVDDPVSKFLIGLRMAALAIKRQHDLEGARSLLRRLSTMATSAVGSHTVAEADGQAMLALILNLQALVEVHEDRPLDAATTMARAASAMADDGFVRISGDMADRYRAQVRANVVQSLYLAGRESEAVAAANHHGSQTRMEHPYSLSEALSLAGYFNQLVNNHTLALSYCHEAERLLIREGAPLRLAMCRRIAVVCMAGIGKVTRAEKLAKALVKDPLGERFLV